MPDDEQDSDDPGSDPHAARRRLAEGSEEASLSDVLALLEHDVLPSAACDAVRAVLVTRGDVANGGMDQVAWNHGVEAARQYAAAWLAIGAVENGELMNRLADALERFLANNDASADSVAKFLAYRKSVGGPYFSLPEPADEVAEVVVEYVIEHANELGTVE